MDVVNNEILYNKHDSHDPPPVPPGLEHSRKRKQACKVVAHLCAVASAKGGRTIWRNAKRSRTESSDGVDSPKAACLHGRTVRRVPCQDQKQLGHPNRKTHRIDARLAACKFRMCSHPRRSKAGTLSGRERRSSTHTQYPRRFMYYENGQWVDFEEEASRVAWESLKACSPLAEITIHRRVYLLNFSEMRQVNIQSGYMRSIAWRDDAGKVSWPSNPCEGPPMPAVGQMGSQGQGTRVNQHRASWRDGAMNSMENCLLRGHVSPGCDMQCTDTSDDENIARVDTELETGCLSVNEHCDNNAPVVPLDVSSGGDFVSNPTDMFTSVAKEQTGSFMGSPFVSLRDGKEYADVKSKFLCGLAKFSSGTIVTGIYRDASPKGQERQQAFKRQIEITKQARGNANVRYAWHGTSKRGVSGIFLHGFGQPKTPKNGSAYGVGVYLAPEHQSHVSAVYADNDENGEQHVVLCLVVVGACELVKNGSEQFHPSSERFDTGVDDLISPKRLIVWSTHMNTHILPLYVVRFKLPPCWHQSIATFRGGLSTRSSHELPVRHFHSVHQTCHRAESLHGEVKRHTVCRQVPTSACIQFQTLFSLLEPLMPPEQLQLLKSCHNEFKAGNISRDKLIKEFRAVVGDHRLIHAIQMLQGDQVKEQLQMKYEVPKSVSAMNGCFGSSLLNV